MDKKFIASSLLFFYIFFSMSYVSPLISHYLFKAYIVKNLCVQRKNPRNNCKGMCHLVKQMKEQDGTEKKAKNNYTNNNRKDNEYCSVQFIDLKDKTKQKQKYVLYYENFIANFISKPLTPPPQSFHKSKYTA